MNTRTIVASLMSGLILGLAILSLGGVEPSPFHVLINRLDSVENVLDTMDDQLSEMISLESYRIGKLYSMADTLLAQNDRVIDVIDNKPPPDDSVPPDPCLEFFEDALMKVQEEAESIVIRAEEALRVGVPPEPCREALDAVADSAQEIVSTVDEYFNPLVGGDG